MRVAILDDYQNVAQEFADWSRLPDGVEATFFHDTIKDMDALVARVEPFEVIGAMRDGARAADQDIVIARRGHVDREVAHAGGHQQAQVRQPLEQGTRKRRSFAHGTAELAFTLILALARNLTVENRSVREGGWQVGISRDLNGATLGIIGLGRLGRQVAGMGRAFGMEILAWSQNLTAERAEEAGATLVSKEELLRRADFVTIHQLLSDRTRGLIDADALACMRPDAFLVNTSRAPIVDTPALVAALKENRIAGAALDVYDVEPLPADDPLRGIDNLLLTPHIGYVTRRTYEKFYGEMLEDILAWIDGVPVRVIVPA